MILGGKFVELLFQASIVTAKSSGKLLELCVLNVFEQT